ncbi:MAG TPA: hypothetical protein VNU44_21810 [Bryobacteraceae bacterium]|jgi:hypothetical protein|nr:hypothetical protein [Bryobacteraceae bacterium]
MIEEEAFMAKDSKTIATTPEHEDSQGAATRTPKPRAMSLEKAKKLIRKTSGEHKGLFRRLAK